MSDLHAIPFEELLRMKDMTTGCLQQQGGETCKKNNKLKNLNLSTSKKVHEKRKPKEVSSRVVERNSIKKSQTAMRVDPRFNTKSGTLNENLFTKSYAFIDDMRRSERDLLTTFLQKNKNHESVEVVEARKELQRMKSREQQKKRATELGRLKKVFQAEESRQIKSSGKKAYFVKRSKFKGSADPGNQKTMDKKVKRKEKKIAKKQTHPIRRREGEGIE